MEMHCYVYITLISCIQNKKFHTLLMNVIQFVEFVWMKLLNVSR